MKKFVLMLAVCLALVLSVASVASAGTKTSAKKTYDGTIKSVSRAVISLYVPDSKGAINLNITPKTTITVNGQPGTVADLVHGQSVSVAVTGYSVTSITVSGN